MISLLIKDQELLDYTSALAKGLRGRFELAFRPDTAAPGLGGSIPSAGQCAATSIVVQSIVGGKLASATVGGISHWFNRVPFRNRILDIDLTADQFGNKAVRIADANQLYKGTRERSMQDLTIETLLRATLLAHRAGFGDAELKLKELLKEKFESQCFPVAR